MVGGGIIVLVKEYLFIIWEICNKYDIWLIIDEVVCGLGCTGKWFGYQYFDVLLDIVIMVKGLVSFYVFFVVTMIIENVFNEFLGEVDEIECYFWDISIYGGCVGAVVVGVVNMVVIEEDNLVENSEWMGAYLFE